MEKPQMLDCDSGYWTVEIRNKDHGLLTTGTVERLDRPETMDEMWERCRPQMEKLLEGANACCGCMLTPLYICRYAKR